jgi:hypothetical protein
MALRTASLILVASATSLKEIFWDSLFALKYFPGDSVVSANFVSPADLITTLSKGFPQSLLMVSPLL